MNAKKKNKSTELQANIDSGDEAGLRTSGRLKKETGKKGDGRACLEIENGRAEREKKRARALRTGETSKQEEEEITEVGKKCKGKERKNLLPSCNRCNLAGGKT